MIVARAHLAKAAQERDAAIRRVADLEAVNEILNEQIEWLRVQIAAKDASILDMRREGFQPPAPNAPERQPEPALHPNVRRAIEARAKPNDPEYHRMADRAKADLAGGMHPEKVAEIIRRGSRLNPFHA